MPQRTQIRRQTKAEIASSSSLGGELTFTTDRNTLHVATDSITTAPVVPPIDDLTTLSSVVTSTDLLLIHDADGSGRKEKKITVDALKTAIGVSGGGTKTLAVFTPMTAQPTATNFATLDTRNNIAVLDFDGGSTNEETTWVGVIPEGANLSSGITVRIFWMATSASSGNCRWGAQFEKAGTNNASDSFDTATEANGAANGTSGIETVTSITCTSIDSLAAGDRFRLKIYRDASDTTNDTMAGDAELIAVELRQVA